MASPKNQNILYRFVSLRNPELSKKENQDLRFVFHPLNDSPLSTTSTNFFKAIHDKVETKTKWQALQEFCVTFESGTSISQAAFTSESQLKSLDEDFYLVADWLAVNKARLDATAIFTKVNTLVNLLTPENVLLIWDNLFYQTVTQKSFYIKENCIQMLVLFNLKEKIVGLTQANAIKIIKQLADARVVLPTSLFEENETIIEDNSAARLNTANQNAAITKEMLDAQDKIIANFLIEDYQKLIKDIEKAQKKYDKEKSIAYNTAYQAHQLKVNPIIATYQKEYNRLKRELCKIPRDANYDPNDFCNQPDLEYPVLPVFEFEYPSIVDSKILESNLPEDSMLLLSNLMDVSELENVSEAIELVKEKIKEQQQEIVSKTVFSKKVMVIGDVVLPLTASKSELNSLTICSKRNSTSLVFYITVGGLSNTSVITKFDFKLTFNNGTPLAEDTILNQFSSNSTIVYSNLFFDYLLMPSQYSAITTISGEATFNDGSVKVFSIAPPIMGACIKSGLTLFTSGSSDIDTPSTQDSFIPKGFGYRQLGIADYRKVVSHVCCYDAGEVAHIENIMAREFKEKTTEKVYSKEITDFISSETEKESVSDSTSTERFEMQTEIAKLLQEDKQFGAHANFTASWGAPGTRYQLDAGANYATNTSKEESNRQAVTQAKELTQRAMERIVTRVRTEKTVKVSESFTDTNSHIFDNRSGGEHVSGVYRFINAIYKNQIYNYGKRLMYEFMIPQPSTLHRLGIKVSNADLNAILLDRPVDPRIAYPTFESINEVSYKTLASKYGADVKNYPVDNIHIGKSFDHYSQKPDLGSAKSDSIQIPDGYYSNMAKFSATAMNSIGAWDNRILVTIGNKPLMTFPATYPDISSGDESRIYDMNYIPVNKFTSQIPIAISITNFHTCAITINIMCNLLPETITNWKKETYQAIIDGYNAQVEAYNQQEAAAKAKGVEMLDSNPLFYRQTEQLILKKNAISYLIDNSVNSKRKMGLPMYNENANFTNYQVTLDQDMDNYTSFVKFMEQAFDWNIMSYNFYPFYWGNANDWDDLYQYDSNDPLFRSFMQAGMARVVVTVKPGFEEAVMHYMKFGQIWNGGQMPVIGNPLYLSIVDELKEQEYEVEETWETVVPTNLVALQRSGVALNVDGLPCGDDCETSSQFEKSLAKLEAPIVKPV